MTRTMYDAVTPRNILLKDPQPQMVAGYLTGPFAWAAADWALFPNATHVTISTQARYLVGHVLDVEVGDATPAQSVDWVLARRSAGADPTVYCNASTWPSVQAAFAARGVTLPHWWAAKYDKVADLTSVPGAVAKQHSGDVPPGIDISVVADLWPGVDIIAINSSEDSMYTVDLAPGQNVRDCIAIPIDRQVRITMCADAEATFSDYGWIAPDGGNGFGEISQTMHDRGAHTITPPKGTAKIDVQYSCVRPIHCVVDVIG